ncbi:hypothetical protein ACQP1U_17340 [Actinomycetota bacterium]
MTALTDHHGLRLVTAQPVPPSSPRNSAAQSPACALGFLLAGLVILTTGLAISWNVTGHWVEIPSVLEVIMLVWLSALHLLAFACAFGEGFGPLSTR